MLITSLKAIVSCMIILVMTIIANYGCQEIGIYLLKRDRSTAFYLFIMMLLVLSCYIKMLDYIWL